MRIASSIRNSIRGSRHVAKILAFLDEIKPIFGKIGELAKKLRESIEEVGKAGLDQMHRVVRSSRYWRQRLDDLARQGHGPQRHEAAVTDRQLLDRSLGGYDPMTGNEVDFDKFKKKYGVEYDPAIHGTPPGFGGRSVNVPGKGDLPIVVNGKILHIAGDHATKFNIPADYVRAYDAVSDTAAFKAFASSASDDFLKVDVVKMKDVFGPRFEARIKGYDTHGNPTKFGPGAKIIAIFRKVDGQAHLNTLYPDP